jgi:hypothetical protein
MFGGFLYCTAPAAANDLSVIPSESLPSSSFLNVLSFDPSGNWQLTFSNTAVSVVVYKGEDVGHMSPITPYNQYHTGDPLGFQDIRNIQITYDRTQDTLTLSGDHIQLDFPEPRLLGFGSNNPYAQSRVPLRFGPLEVASGCNALTQYREQLQPSADGSAFAYYSIQQLVHFDEQTPGACNAYLQDMAKKIQNGTAPPYWRLAYGTGVLDLNRITEVMDVGMAAFFQIQRPG